MKRSGMQQIEGEGEYLHLYIGRDLLSAPSQEVGGCKVHPSSLPKPWMGRSSCPRPLLTEPTLAQDILISQILVQLNNGLPGPDSQIVPRSQWLG